MMTDAMKDYLREHLPFYRNLTPEEKETLENSAYYRAYRKKELIYNGLEDCAGLYLVKKGEMRAFIVSDSGRELTVFRLFEFDICLFSASCLLSEIDFELSVEAAVDTEAILIPNAAYNELLKNIKVLAYTNRLLSSRFNDVMFLIRQTIFAGLDKRLASFLIEQAAVAGGDVIEITHEEIANHIASAREAVTRMLKFFQNERLISVGRGKIEIIDFSRLNKIASA